MHALLYEWYIILPLSHFVYVINLIYALKSVFIVKIFFFFAFLHNQEDFSNYKRGLTPPSSGILSLELYSHPVVSPECDQENVS